MSRFSVILPEGSVLLKNEETSQVLRLSAEEGPLCLGTVEMSMLLNPMPVPVPSVKALAEDQASPEESTPSEEVEEVSTSSDEKEEAPSEEPPKEPETPKPAFLSRLEAQAEASRAQREAERRGERWASVAPVVSMAAVSSTPSTPIPEEKDEYSLRDEEESLSSSEEGEGVNTFFAPSEAPAPQFVMPKIETPVPVFEPGLHETLDRVEHGEPWMPPPVLPAGSSPSASMDAKNLTQKITQRWIPGSSPKSLRHPNQAKDLIGTIFAFLMRHLKRSRRKILTRHSNPWLCVATISKARWNTCARLKAKKKILKT